MCRVQSAGPTQKPHPTQRRCPCHSVPPRGSLPPTETSPDRLSRPCAPGGAEEQRGPRSPPAAGRTWRGGECLGRAGHGTAKPGTALRRRPAAPGPTAAAPGTASASRSAASRLCRRAPGACAERPRASAELGRCSAPWPVGGSTAAAAPAPRGGDTRVTPPGAVTTSRSSDTAPSRDTARGAVPGASSLASHSQLIFP